jgi:hypothetical protein
MPTKKKKVSNPRDLLGFSWDAVKMVTLDSGNFRQTG